MPLPPDEFSVVASYVLHLAELVEARGVRRSELFRGLVADPAALAAPGVMVERRVLDSIVDRAIAATGEPALAVLCGLDMQLSWHGFAGFAAMSAATLGDAIQQAVEFGRLVCPGMDWRFESSRDGGRLVLTLGSRHGAARDFVLLAAVVGYATVGRALTGRPVVERVEVDVPRPVGFERYGHDLACPLVFDAPACVLNFPADALSAPIRSADPSALALARAQCEQQLRTHREARPHTKRARELAPDAVGFRSMEDVARLVGCSPRTFHRQLHAEGTSFVEIVDELKHARALELLRDRRLSIAEVAHTLGYSDVANFNRAFRRWRGQSPGTYRKGP